MDIRTMKTQFIERYKRINDPELLERFEQLLREAEQEELKPIDKEELERRSQQSEHDIKQGNTITIDELESQNW